MKDETNNDYYARCGDCYAHDNEACEEWCQTNWSADKPAPTGD